MVGGGAVMVKRLPLPPAKHITVLQPSGILLDANGCVVHGPGIVDIPDWRAVKERKRRRRQKWWGRLCWGWFVVVLAYACLSDPENPKVSRMSTMERRAYEAAMSEERKSEIHESARQFMWIASVPLAVRGFFQRVRSGG